MSKCIITGCSFVDEASNKSVYGDLHEEGDCFIFRCCVDDDAQPLWEYGVACGMGSGRQVVAHFGHDYFQANGVIVISKSRARLNDEAAAYISR